MSRAVSLFDLAGELSRKNERAANGTISVVPVLVDDLAAAIPVLAALCTLNEGKLLNALEAELGGPVPATPDPLKRAAIAEALTAKPMTSRHVDLVDLADGLVDASFAEPPSPIPSQGEQEVLAVARAVAHRDLDDHGFAVIAYRENLIDLPFRRAIWVLAVDHLNGMRHNTLRTLVLVAETAIEVDGLHCETGRGFQFALDGHRLLRRKGADDLRAAAGEIAKHPEPIVLFLGAGMSASSHLPVGNAMRDDAIRRLLSIPDHDQVASIALAARFHKWIADKGWLLAQEQEMPQEKFIRQLTVEQVIRIEQRVDPSLPTLRDFRDEHDQALKAPGPAVLDLGDLLERAAGRIVIVAVNYDRLIETHTKAPLRVFATSKDFVDAPDYVRRFLAGEEKDIPFLKLHGTISDLDTCVISTEQTEMGIGKDKLETLRALLDTEHRRLWVYVGASMRDLDLRPLLLGEEFARGVDERWVSPFLVESVEEFGAQREPSWGATGLHTAYDRLITETADAFFSALRSAWPGGD